MKLRNNNQITCINLSLLSTFLIYFALDKCLAHNTAELDYQVMPTFHDANIKVKSTFHDSYLPKQTNSETPSSFPHSEAPEASNDAAAPSSFPHSEAPEASNDAAAPNAAGYPASGNKFSYSSSFTGAFSDILEGTIGALGSAKNDKNGVVEQICAHTRYPDVCVDTITPLLNHHIHIDITKVLEGAIKACARQVKLTISKVEMHAAKSPELADALADCKEKYHNALKSLRSAIDCISHNDFGKLSVTLSGIMADVSTCESKFEDLKSSTTVSKTDGLVSITVNNCQSIASLIRR